jgi:hypothetical protein
MVTADPSKGFLYITPKKISCPTSRSCGAKVAGGSEAPGRQPPADTDLVRYVSLANSMRSGLSTMDPPWFTLAAYDFNSGTIPVAERPAIRVEGPVGCSGCPPACQDS